MAKRYSGDIELRLSYKKYRGWNGKMGMFYFATVAAPGYRRRGILSPREVGIDLSKEDPQSAESYDQVAMAFLGMGEEADGVVRKYGSIENGTVSLLRVQQAPCPVAEKGRVARKGRERDPSGPPKDYAEAKRLVDAIGNESKAASAALQSFPKRSNGLTPDEVKFSPEFRAAKARFDAAFARERTANAWFYKTFKKEIRAERASRGR